MTTAKMTRTGFTIKGHAGYARYGYDVVCAGISTLVFTFLRCVDTQDLKIDNGLVKCSFQELKDNDYIYYDYLITGLEMIAEQYPDYLEVITW